MVYLVFKPFSRFLDSHFQGFSRRICMFAVRKLVNFIFFLKTNNKKKQVNLKTCKKCFKICTWIIKHFEITI